MAGTHKEGGYTVYDEPQDFTEKEWMNENGELLAVGDKWETEDGVPMVTIYAYGESDLECLALSIWYAPYDHDYIGDWTFNEMYCGDDDYATLMELENMGHPLAEQGRESELLYHVMSGDITVESYMEELEKKEASEPYDSDGNLKKELTLDDFPMPDYYISDGFQRFFEPYVVPVNLWLTMYGETYALVDMNRINQDGVEYLKIYGYASPDSTSENEAIYKYTGNLGTEYDLVGHFEFEREG